MRKKTHKMKLISFSFLLVIFFIGLIFQGDNSNNKVTNDENYVKNEELYDIIDDDDEIELPINPKTSGSLTSHDPIHIDGNWTDALIHGICTGLGTYHYPYIIENLEIDGGNTRSGIIIENSDAYLIIQNCRITNTDSSGLNGIYLYRTNNTQILNNEISNSFRAIELNVNCTNNLVKNNVIYDVSSMGITLAGTSVDSSPQDNFVINNTVYNCATRGIYLNQAYYNNIEDNEAVFNGRGIWLSNSWYNYLENNNVSYNNYDGIYLSYATLNTINRSSIEYNGQSGSYDGIYMANSDSNVITRSTIIGNSDNGIYMAGSTFCDGNDIMENIISNNGGTGVYIPASGHDNNEIYSNRFEGNTRHAYDMDSSNNWYKSNIGNSWDNHTDVDADDNGICDNSYDYIAGTSGNIDSYPIYGDAVHDGGPIEIDGSLGSGPLSWQYISTRIWCSGSGTKNNPYVISDLEVAGNANNIGINITDSSVYFRIENCHVYNSTDVDSLTSAGILFFNVDNGAIINCNVSNNGHHSGSYGHGILLSNACRNITISRTIVENNNYHGIYFRGGFFNVLKNNIIQNNGIYGLYLFSSANFNNFSYNLFAGNAYCAYISSSDSNNFWGNQFSKSSGASPKGVFITSNSDDNIFWENYFTGNTDYHVSNNDADNVFNSSTIGNYWDDYSGVDAWDDGIGDTPYITEGAIPIKDWSPIWDDGNNGTVIYIDGTTPFDSGSMNWDYAVTRSWCSGSGTKTDPYIIENLKIDGGGSPTVTCFFLRDNYDYVIIRNCTFTNGGSSTVSNDAGLKAQYGVYYTTIVNCNISSNQAFGLWLNAFYDSYLYNNTIENNGDEGCRFTGDRHLILSNTFSKNTDYGLGVYINTPDDYLYIINNTFYDNDYAGLRLYHVHYSTIASNRFVENGYESVGYDDGIAISDNVNENTFSYNIFDNNDGAGIMISDSATGVYNNYFHHNEFYNEVQHAYDNEGTNNQWDDGEVGNYWDDYTGIDADDDGIGDTAYDVDPAGGVTDRYPIWWDKPKISIVLPLSTYYKDPPPFQISMDEGVMDTGWYIIGALPTKYYFSGTSGTIDTDGWNAMSSGSLRLRFYVNDSRDYVSDYAEIYVTKDIDPPQISITTPNPNDFFGYTPPSFTTNINDVDSVLNTTWYTIIGGSKNVTFDYASQPVDVDPDLWLEIPNGSFTLRIYANDTFNNWDYEDIKLYKDIIDPIVTIVSPNDGDLFGTTPPPVTLNIIEPNEEKTEYEMIDGVHLPSNVSWTGAINPIAWNGLENGTVMIKFHCHDKGGNIGSASVTVRRDIIAPRVIVNDPGNLTYHDSKPDIQVTATDPSKVNKTWYEHGGNIYELQSGMSQALDDEVWNWYDSEAQIDLLIFANDTVGNLNNTYTLTIYKDEYNPRVTINLPGNNTYWNNKPWINISVVDLYFDSVWYEYASNVYDLENGVAEELNDGIWTTLSPEQQFDIFIFANDSAGNINNTFSLRLYKDVVTPTVEVNEPEDGKYFNFKPNIQITGFDTYINTTWYESGIYKIIVPNGFSVPLDQNLWDSLSDEQQFTINIFVNDSAGNENNTFSLTLYKDMLAPRVTIDLPDDGSLDGKWAPEYNLTITEPYEHKKWYTLFNQSNSYVTPETEFTLNNDYINQQIWDEIGNGTNFLVNITFFVNDSAGNFWIGNVTVWKDTTTPFLSIIDPNTDDLFATTAPQCDFDISGTNLDSYWHRLYYHESTSWGDNSTTTGAAEMQYNDIPIDPGLWSAFGNGTITIRFYVNNSNGMLYYDDVVVRKDIENPKLTIISPDPALTQKFSSPPNFKLYIVEGNLNTTWYQLYSVSTGWSETREFVGNSTIASDLWEACDYEEIIIKFFANDTMGNLNDTEEVTVEKIAPPVILPPGDDDDGGGDDDEDTGIPWYIQAAIGGVISASAGIIIKQSYSSTKKRRILMESMRDNFSRLPNKEAFLIEKLGYDKFKEIEHIWIKFRNNQIDDKDFLKEGKKVLGRDFVNMFTLPKEIKKKKKLR